MDMDGGSCASISTTFPLLFPILVTCQVLQKETCQDVSTNACLTHIVAQFEGSVTSKSTAHSCG